jgi:chromosome segregation ATPase
MLKTFVLIFLTVLIATDTSAQEKSVAAQDSTQPANRTSDLVLRSLEAEHANLRSEKARLTNEVNNARREYVSASQRLKSIRKRLGARRVSSLTVNEATRLEEATESAARARARLRRSRWDLGEIEDRIAVVKARMEAYETEKPR